jgi:hypothetical protein
LYEGFVDKIQNHGLLINANFLRMLKTLDNFSFPESPVDGYESQTKQFLEWRELGKKGSEDHHFW